MGIAACHQCGRANADNALICPNCGAVQKLNPKQRVARISKRAMVGGSVGLFAGVACMLLLAIGLTVANLLTGHKPNFFHTSVTLLLFGAVVGGMIGAMLNAVFEVYRQQ